jgi:hypothetical protein
VCVCVCVCQCARSIAHVSGRNYSPPILGISGENLGHASSASDCEVSIGVETKCCTQTTGKYLLHHCCHTWQWSAVTEKWGGKRAGASWPCRTPARLVRTEAREPLASPKARCPTAHFAYCHGHELAVPHSSALVRTEAREPLASPKAVCPTEHLRVMPRP